MAHRPAPRRAAPCATPAILAAASATAPAVLAGDQDMRRRRRSPWRRSRAWRSPAFSAAVVVLGDDQDAPSDHPRFVLQLGDQLRDRADLDAGLARLAAPRPSARRAAASTSTPSSSGVVVVDRLLLRLHDVGQRRIARLVEAQIGGDDRRQLDRHRLEPAIDLARDRAPRRPSISTFEAKVACGQPSSAASIWPVWLQSSSIACLPRMTSSGLFLRRSPPSAAWRRRAAASRRRSRPGCRGRRPWRARCGSSPGTAPAPIDTATISVDHARFLEPHRLFDGDLVERVHRHLDVGDLDARPSALTRILTL